MRLAISIAAIPHVITVSGLCLFGRTRTHINTTNASPFGGTGFHHNNPPEQVSSLPYCAVAVLFVQHHHRGRSYQHGRCIVFMSRTSPYSRGPLVWTKGRIALDELLVQQPQQTDCRIRIFRALSDLNTFRKQPQHRMREQHIISLIPFKVYFVAIILL
jgi:hypothetical protein